jgi:enamine deaminase RidA (YjgF/YER057c/UK114 family)
MVRRLVSSGSSFEEQIGYSRAVIDGRWVFVAGTTGFNYKTMTLPRGGIVAQTKQCLANVEEALIQAGSSFDDVVRVRYIVPKAAEFKACWPLLQAAFGKSRPAATMISAGLIDPRIKIEIEVTARRPAQARKAKVQPLTP